MRITRARLFIIGSIVSSNLLFAGAQTQTQQMLQADQILTHLGRTTAWFHRLQALEPDVAESDDLISRDRIREDSIAALQLSFDFARAAVPLVTPANGTQSKPEGNASDSTLDRAVTHSADRIAALQARLNEIDAQRTKASGSTLATLDAQRQEIEAALALAKDVQATVQNLAQFAARGTINGQAGAGFVGQINQLERSVPEARHATAKAPGSGQAAAPSAVPAASPSPGLATAPSSPYRPESAGLIALTARLFTLRAHQSDLDDALAQTDALLKSVDDVRAPLIGSTRELLRQIDTAPASSQDAAEATHTRQSLQSAASDFKRLSTVIVPIAEQAIATEASRGALLEWRERVSAELGTTVRFLIFRAMTLAVVVGVVLLLSEVWRRATFRYLHDARRRRQFLLLRRVVVTIAILIVVLIGVVSELGSLATYIGFVTAGVALALQNVILAVVAYFFLIGRYGVRVGDRITLAGVTGNVIDIGLVRIYLMELTGGDFHPTGRIVVLSNAVLFQPAALFKQVPGADYVWHALTLTVAAGADAQTLENRLRAAADSVYEHYRPAIEQQYARLQRYVNIDTLAPHPEVMIRLTSAGYECTVRYPAEPPRAAETNRKMIEALRKAIAEEPAVTLVSSTGPTVES